jgi:hypothetical protein
MDITAPIYFYEISKRKIIIMVSNSITCIIIFDLNPDFQQELEDVGLATKKLKWVFETVTKILEQIYTIFWQWKDERLLHEVLLNNIIEGLARFKITFLLL